MHEKKFFLIVLLLPRNISRGNTQHFTQEVVESDNKSYESRTDSTALYCLNIPSSGRGITGSGVFQQDFMHSTARELCKTSIHPFYDAWNDREERDYN